MNCCGWKGGGGAPPPAGSAPRYELRLNGCNRMVLDGFGRPHFLWASKINGLAIFLDIYALGIGRRPMFIC